jgi:hypothetical protein
LSTPQFPNLWSKPVSSNCVYEWNTDQVSKYLVAC